MKKIYILKGIVNTLTHKEFMAYISLKAYIDLNLNTANMKESLITCITLETMIYSLFGELQPEGITKYFKSDLISGLESLIEKGIIELKDKSKTGYILELRNLYINKGDIYYCTTEDEIYKILCIKTKERFSFFHYAQKVFSTVWNGAEYKFGCTSIDEMADDIGITSVTAISYNELLENNQIIYIERNKYANRHEDGTIRNQANTYGRYEDKELVIQASKNFGGRVYDRTKKLDSSTKKSIRAFYNSYCNDTYKGSVKRLYEDTLRYNDDDTIKRENRQLDLSVFPIDIDELEEVIKVEKPNKVSKPKKEQDKFLDNKKHLLIKEKFDEEENPFGEEESPFDREKVKNAECVNDYDFSDNTIVINRKPKSEIKEEIKLESSPFDVHENLSKDFKSSLIVPVVHDDDELDDYYDEYKDDYYDFEDTETKEELKWESNPF